MPRKLNKEHVQFLKTMLNQHEENIKLEVNHTILNEAYNTYIELAGASADVGDASIAESIIYLNDLRIKKRLLALNDIQNALQKINHGNYGLCLDCNHIIRFKRLAAYPTATRCIDCQTVKERSYH
jgi:DnaK suppressor protein